ncbi:MAG TPA: DUF4837 family protein [Cyclobacteriaceae bacterium]|nr:DUF4837 family protein [Cyclobacteriaceae bacterium]
MLRIILLLTIISCLYACGSGSKNKDYLPKATGSPGDIILVIDSMQWKGPVGEELRNIFSADVPGLPRDESLFNVINVHPSDKIYLLTQIRNLIYVFTLDQKTPGAQRMIKEFTPETIDQIRSDSSYYIYTAEDVNAKGQEVVYLFGQTQESLIRHLKENGQNLIDLFNNLERERLEAKLFKTKTTGSISEFLKKEQQCSIGLPYGFKLADKQNDFIWFRQIELEVDKDVFITWKPYESEYQLLPDSLIAWRDATTKKYLFEDPENVASYILTETEVPFNPVTARQSRINNHYAMELRGLWRTNNKSMGGPFVGYALVDEPRGLVYYIEGFTYSPSKPQREIMRELETILKTFKTSADLNKK